MIKDMLEITLRFTPRTNMTTKTRVRSAKRTPKVLYEACTYIDPLNCDSTISYKVIDGTRNVWGSVQLADCNRKIEWSFWNSRTPLSKIDRAIEALQSFRNELKEGIDNRTKSDKLKRTVSRAKLKKAAVKLIVSNLSSIA